MKKHLLTAMLTLSFLLPLTLLPTNVQAEWFRVYKPGSWADLYSEAGNRKGRLRCRIPHGNYLIRDGEAHIYKRRSGDEHSGVVMPDGTSLVTSNSFVRVGGSDSSDGLYVRVKWMRKLGVAEWDWRDAMNNHWCQHWNRKGWVDKKLLRIVNKPGGIWIN